MERRAAAVFAGLVLGAVVVAAVAETASVPFYGLSGSQAAARLHLVDPVSLRPGGRALPLGRFSGERAFSPNGSTLAIASQGRPAVALVDVARLRIVGTAALVAAGEVQALRLTSRGVVALVDQPRGSVLVWLDSDRRAVTRVLRYRGELADLRLAGGRVVALEWPSGRVGPVRLNVVDADGRARSFRVDRIRGGWGRHEGEVVRMAEPGLAVDPAGERAWLVDGDGEICEVALDSLAVRCNLVRAPAKNGAPWSRRQLRFLDEGLLALSGWEKPQAGQSAAKPIGLWLVDSTTWRRRLLDRGIDSFRHAGGVVVGVRRNGVSAYSLDGSRAYAIEEPLQLGVISTAGPYLYIPRADERTVVAMLATGRVIGRPKAAAQPLQQPDTW